MSTSSVGSQAANLEVQSREWQKDYWLMILQNSRQMPAQLSGLRLPQQSHQPALSNPSLQPTLHMLLKLSQGLMNHSQQHCHQQELMQMDLRKMPLFQVSIQMLHVSLKLHVLACCPSFDKLMKGPHAKISGLVCAGPTKKALTSLFEPSCKVLDLPGQMLRHAVRNNVKVATSCWVPTCCVQCASVHLGMCCCWDVTQACAGGSADLSIGTVEHTRSPTGHSNGPPQISKAPPEPSLSAPTGTSDDGIVAQVCSSGQHEIAEVHGCRNSFG